MLGRSEKGLGTCLLLLAAKVSAFSNAREGAGDGSKLEWGICALLWKRLLIHSLYQSTIYYFACFGIDFEGCWGFIFAWGHRHGDS